MIGVPIPLIYSRTLGARFHLYYPSLFVSKAKRGIFLPSTAAHDAVRASVPYPIHTQPLPSKLQHPTTKPNSSALTELRRHIKIPNTEAGQQ